MQNLIPERLDSYLIDEKDHFLFLAHRWTH